jgi:Glycosyl hydrolase family 20, catalytic domain
MEATSSMKRTTNRRPRKASQSSRNANKRVLRIFTVIVFMGTFAMGVLMNYITKEDVDKLVGFDVEETAFGFLPDDIHLSLISNTTRINLRQLILGKPRRKKRKWLNWTDAPVPDGMRAIQLTLSWENATFEVGSFVDEDVTHIYSPRFVFVRHHENMDDLWVELNTTRSNYTDPLMEPSNSTTKVNLPFEPSTQYLGVLLDAGRSYFPLEWIRNLLDLLAQMNYNLVHFRLTDDQAFNIRLDSYPELAHAAWNAPTNTTVYTPDELRALVQYASERGIILMPEINVPGHAGGWAGNAPGLVVPCAPFVCHHGYGLPLNISHVGIYDMIESIIREVMGIFSTSPFIHLGGDEVEMAEPCFDDVGQDMMDYNVFEERLEGILKTLQIPQTRVARWEMTGQRDVRNRVGKIPHYWFSTNYM